MEQEFRKLVQDLQNHKCDFDFLCSYVRSHSLSSSQQSILVSSLKKLDPSSSCIPSHSFYKVAFLSSYTATPIVTAFTIAFLKQNLFLIAYEPPFGSIELEVYNDKSSLYKFNPELIVFYPSHDLLNCQLNSYLPDDEIDKLIDISSSKITAIFDHLYKKLKCKVINFSFIEIRNILCGPAERLANWTESQFFTRLNINLFKGSPSFVSHYDLNLLVQSIGSSNWFDNRYYYNASFPFSPYQIKNLEISLGSLIRQVLSNPYKVLVLDCDNTLWGGVIGDDGIDGILLGPESPESRAFYDFCKYINSLFERGIILALCTKNNHNVINELFSKHPHMPLKLEHFACIKANWQPKSTNIFEISKAINVDLSSIVFIDDNPAECALVQQKLPAVRTIQLPPNVETYVSFFDSLSLFYSPKFLQEDSLRASSYSALGALLSDNEKSVADIRSFLISLEMFSLIETVGEKHLDRIVQMESKTNQFNLSTRRLKKEDLMDNMNNSHYLLLCANLSDKYANHGLVTYLQGFYEGNLFIISDWLMSCRVFQRNLEYLVFSILAKQLAKNGITSVKFMYKPTSKNTVILDFIESLSPENDKQVDHIIHLDQVVYPQLNIKHSFNN